ncbi:hypothetical protein QYM36_001673 [Artemia franciscana]|nr:hypothetical protein QYM36_001673 [Artemia franciscana]
MDLITAEDRRNAHQKLLNERVADEIIFTYCKNEQSPGIRKILPTLQKLLKRKLSISVETGRTSDINLMIVGIPNVGKSSLINMLRAKHLSKGNAAPVGAVAGITRSLQEKVKICENPKIYLLDTPGIMIPAIKDAETGMKLAACATLKDHLVGPELIADYILYWMNKEGIYSYVDAFQLPTPSDDITEVLTRIAISQSKFLSIRQGNGEKRSYPNFKHAAEQFIKAFRTGQFGKLMLDSDLM